MDLLPFRRRFAVGDFFAFLRRDVPAVSSFRMTRLLQLRNELSIVAGGCQTRVNALDDSAG
jgi:hypothetical protein